MTRFAGLILAGGIMLSAASTADAQMAISIGNPYYGQGLSVGTGGYGYAPYGYSGYGYAPTTVYSSGYAGYAAPVRTYATTTYVAPRYSYPAYGYRGYPAYGYRNYGYGGWGRGFGWRRGFRRW